MELIGVVNDDDPALIALACRSDSVNDTGGVGAGAATDADDCSPCPLPLNDAEPIVGPLVGASKDFGSSTPLAAGTALAWALPITVASGGSGAGLGAGVDRKSVV